jgi:beta-phosphoglucomutase
MTEQQFASCFGRTSRDIIRYFWGDRIDEPTMAAWDAEKEAAYRDILRAHFPEMDGAGELVRALHEAGIAMAIGSSGPAENVDLARNCLPGGELIRETVNGMEVTHGKPDPEVFLTAARKLGIEPARCAVVEDAPAGVEAARRAQMTAVAITGTAPRDKLAERAHLVVDSLRELTPERLRSLIESAGSSA